MSARSGFAFACQLVGDHRSLVGERVDCGGSVPLQVEASDPSLTRVYLQPGYRMESAMRGGGRQDNLGLSYESGDSTYPGNHLPPCWMRGRWGDREVAVRGREHTA